MLRWADLLAKIGVVRAFDYPYMAAGRKHPDPLPRLIAAHRGALQQLRASYPGPVVLVGKSMGSRVGCHVSLEEDVAALVCLGYPLCGGGNPTKLRDQVLREIQTPILFIQGTRDSLCPLPLLEKILAEMSVPHELYVVEGGDHSLNATKGKLKASQQTQREVDQGILKKIESFVRARLPRVGLE
jgi:uncharacterized protein